MSKVSAELLRGPAEQEDEPKKIYGVVTATVGPSPDPLFLSRVQVMLHFIDCMDMSAFARVATMFTGPLSGSYFIPMPGDEVLVAFEHGDVNSPYVIGSLWNATHPPPLPSQFAMIRAIRTVAGTQIVFTDGPPSITMQLGAPGAVPGAPGPLADVILTPGSIQISALPTTLTVTKVGITMQTGGSTLAVTPEGVVITAPEVSIVAGNIRLN
jgi:hypothetical protein